MADNHNNWDVKTIATRARMHVILEAKYPGKNHRGVALKYARMIFKGRGADPARLSEAQLLDALQLAKDINLPLTKGRLEKVL